MSELLSYENALAIVKESAHLSSSGQKNIEDALDHVLAEDIYADRNYPPFNRAGMDGYAVNYDDILSGRESFEVLGSVFAGTNARIIAKPGSTVKIMTGAPVPDGFDAVIKKEDITLNGNQISFVPQAASKFGNIAQMAEDAQKGDLVIGRGAFLTSVNLGICAGFGYSKVQVYKKPRVALITTGNEVVAADSAPEFFQIRNTNYFTIRSLLSYLGIPLTFHQHVHDDPEKLRSAIQSGLESDLLILTGGVSMGDSDHVPRILEEEGVKKIFHKLKVRPGKPVWFGKKDQARPVFGLPGNPVSCQVAFKMFVEPLILQSMGFSSTRKFRLPLLHSYAKKHKLTEFVNSKIVTNDSGSAIEPIKNHGSGDYISIKESHGLFIMPEKESFIEANSLVDFIPWKNF